MLGVPRESSPWPLWWGMALFRAGSAVEGTRLSLQTLNSLECSGLKGLRAREGCLGGGDGVGG